jgi:ATP-dependent Clp protease ATP-binding subunit ClpB
MPRSRTYASNAERQRAYRARLMANVTIPEETSRTQASTDSNRNTKRNATLGEHRGRTDARRQLDPTRKSEVVEKFERSLHQKVVGQDAALDAVVDVFQMFMAGMSPQDRPVGNLLFLGPTGTGKTRVAEAVADTLFGDPRALIKIDCAEFQHSHEISKLVGSPPGYLGHRETHPVITQEALEQWRTETLKLSLILFDEIEKASDALWQLLLGVLDKGILTLGDNRRVDLSDCIIIMTSNLGAVQMNSLAEGGMGFVSSMQKSVDAAFDDKITRAAQEAARRKFSPEFMNRIDKVVVFKTLRQEHLKQILELELDAVETRVKKASQTQLLFTWNDDVKRFLVREGADPKYGARHLKRAIERILVFPISNLIATGQIEDGDSVEVTLGEDGKFLFTAEAEGSGTPTLLAKSGKSGLKPVRTAHRTKIIDNKLKHPPSQGY